MQGIETPVNWIYQQYIHNLQYTKIFGRKKFVRITNVFEIVFDRTSSYAVQLFVLIAFFQ